MDDQPNALASPSVDAAPTKPVRRSKWWIVLYLLAAMVILLVAARLMAPWAIRGYVNRTLDRSLIYQGKIGEIELHFWRGAYSIQDLRVVKMTGNVPVPLFAAKRVEFALQWNAILHRKWVGQIVMMQPELNFVDSSNDADAQTGAGGPWLQIIQDLFPFKINSVQVHDGSVHFRAFGANEPVDVYLSHVEGTIDNLTNIQGETTPLITTVKATALAMDQAKFEYQMKLNPFSYRPTFHLGARLLGLDVTKTNNLARAYGAFDFKRGWFDLVIELDAKEGQLTGYVKPLFRNLQVFNLKTDVRDDNPLQFFWQALVGVATKALTNPERDQFGTLIPFHGDVGDNKPDVLGTIGNVLRNAFVRAYLPKLQLQTSGGEGLEFEPPSLSESISAGDKP